MNPRYELQGVYKGKTVRTDVREDMRFLYEDERLSSGDLCEVFGLSNTVVNQNRVARKLKRAGVKMRDFKGPNNPSWVEGRKTGKGGYILAHRPDHPQANSQGYVSEHRIVMEEKLGRYLDPEEIVHHKDKNRKNNSPGNLALLESNSAHALLESKLRRRDKLGRFM